MKYKFLLFIFILIFPVYGIGEITTVTLEMDSIISRSLFNKGNTVKIRNIMAQARKGGEINFGVIGGSITCGANASIPEKSYAALVHKWWQNNFPKSKINYINAGIGATGSLYGCHRVKYDLLIKKPDFVIVEFGVNDLNVKYNTETYEGLLRQILKSPDKPAVILLFMMAEGGINTQKEYSQIGIHYNLPMISFRDAFYPLIEQKKIKWQDLYADYVHPNDLGHKYCADLINDYLNKIKDDMPETELPQVTDIPPPIISDVFEYTEKYTPGNMKPFANNGWKDFDWGWSSDKPGSRIEFKVKGSVISILYFRIRKNMGIAKASVDDFPPVMLDAWFDQTWGGYPQLEILAKNLENKEHTITITLTNEKAKESTGNQFDIQAILTAGNE